MNDRDRAEDLKMAMEMAVKAAKTPGIKVIGPEMPAPKVARTYSVEQLMGIAWSMAAWKRKR